MGVFGCKNTKDEIWAAKDTNEIVTYYKHEYRYGISLRMEYLPEIQFVFSSSFILTWT